jgi:hypothetical protein
MYGCNQHAHWDTSTRYRLSFYLYWTIVDIYNKPFVLCIFPDLVLMWVSRVVLLLNSATSMYKNDVLKKRNYHGQTTIVIPEKMRFENIKYLTLTQFFIWILSYYGLNLCRYSNPGLPPLRDLASLYFLMRHIFVYATLFRGIKLNVTMRFPKIPGNKVAHTKLQ